MVALPFMLLACWPFRERVRLVLADYNLDDSLQNHVLEHYKEFVDTGLLVYLRSSMRSRRRRSRGKLGVEVEVGGEARIHCVWYAWFVAQGSFKRAG